MGILGFLRAVVAGLRPLPSGNQAITLSDHAAANLRMFEKGVSLEILTDSEVTGDHRITLDVRETASLLRWLRYIDGRRMAMAPPRKRSVSQRSGARA